MSRHEKKLSPVMTAGLDEGPEGSAMGSESDAAAAGGEREEEDAERMAWVAANVDGEVGAAMLGGCSIVMATQRRGRPSKMIADAEQEDGGASERASELIYIPAETLLHKSSRRRVCGTRVALKN